MSFSATKLASKLSSMSKFCTQGAATATEAVMCLKTSADPRSWRMVVGRSLGDVPRHASRDIEKTEPALLSTRQGNSMLMDKSMQPLKLPVHMPCHEPPSARVQGDQQLECHRACAAHILLLGERASRDEGRKGKRSNKRAMRRWVAPGDRRPEWLRIHRPVCVCRQ